MGQGVFLLLPAVPPSADNPPVQRDDAAHRDLSLSGSLRRQAQRLLHKLSVLHAVPLLFYHISYRILPSSGEKVNSTLAERGANWYNT